MLDQFRFERNRLRSSPRFYSRKCFDNGVSFKAVFNNFENRNRKAYTLRQMATNMRHLTSSLLLWHYFASLKRPVINISPANLMLQRCKGEEIFPTIRPNANAAFATGIIISVDQIRTVKSQSAIVIRLLNTLQQKAT